MPFAQVYDIISLPGKHLEVGPDVTKWEEVNALFEATFGKPIYDISL